MSKYNETIETIKKESSSTGYSRPVEEKLASALLNDTEYCKKQYVKKGDSFAVKESYPVKEFRDGLKQTLVKEFGIDPAEANKLDKVDFNKGVTTPFADLANTHVMGCMKTGKSYVFNPEDERSTKMQISLREMPAKIIETTKLVQDETGKYNTVPTGDKIQYTDRTEIVAANKHLSTTKYKLK